MSVFDNEQSPIINGRRYIAVESKFGCSGCEFENNIMLCFKTPYCSSASRNDGKTVIFIKEHQK